MSDHPRARHMRQREQLPTPTLKWGPLIIPRFSGKGVYSARRRINPRPWIVAEEGRLCGEIH
jgi:hypothetical protein